VGLGQPAQSTEVILDTGSSELWVDPDCRTIPTSEQAECSLFGKYDPAQSRTPARRVAVGGSSTKRINYGDTSNTATLSFVDIAYWEDSVTVGGR
jgi:hypothetical protein